MGVIPNPTPALYVGIFPASVPLENPQWHVKMAPFVCRVAALNTSWCHFYTERAKLPSNLPNERDRRCKTEEIVMDWQCLTHPFGLTIVPFSFFTPIVSSS